jgi:hypothetical protein
MDPSDVKLVEVDDLAVPLISFWSPGLPPPQPGQFRPIPAPNEEVVVGGRPSRDYFQYW